MAPSRMAHFSQKYRLGERVGSGGMAEVFRATLVGAAGFEREIALKRIRPEMARERAFVDMFIREASLAASRRSSDRRGSRSRSPSAS
jgi:serine/threonine-protein kinase